MRYTDLNTVRLWIALLTLLALCSIVSTRGQSAASPPSVPTSANPGPGMLSAGGAPACGTGGHAMNPIGVNGSLAGSGAAGTASSGALRLNGGFWATVHDPLRPIPTPEVPDPRRWQVRLRPNPSLDHTSIVITGGADERVDIAVFDLGGRCVRKVLDRELTSGTHVVDWDGRDDRGMAAAPGIYFVRIATPTRSVVKKLMLIR